MINASNVCKTQQASCLEPQCSCWTWLRKSRWDPAGLSELEPVQLLRPDALWPFPSGPARAETTCMSQCRASSLAGLSRCPCPLRGAPAGGFSHWGDLGPFCWVCFGLVWFGLGFFASWDRAPVRPHASAQSHPRWCWGHSESGAPRDVSVRRRAQHAALRPCPEPPLSWGDAHLGARPRLIPHGGHASLSKGSGVSASSS